MLTATTYLLPLHHLGFQSIQAAKLNNFRRSVPAGMSQAISASVYPASMQEELPGAVDGKVEVTSTEKDSNKDRQKIRQVWNYPTTPEWCTPYLILKNPLQQKPLV